MEASFLAQLPTPSHPHSEPTSLSNKQPQRNAELQNSTQSTPTHARESASSARTLQPCRGLPTACQGDSVLGNARLAGFVP